MYLSWEKCAIPQFYIASTEIFAYNISVDTTRDDVLNLSDLIEGRIDPDKFLDENFKTRGMYMLFGFLDEEVARK